MTTPHSNPITILDLIINEDKQEIAYWNARNIKGKKIVRNFVNSSKQSINNLEKLKQILIQSEQQ